MSRRYILTEYVLRALEQAVHDKLEDETFAARIPGCPGVVAFAPTLRSCEREFQSTLEDWILLGLKLRHPLPILNDIDLNREPTREPGGRPVSVPISAGALRSWVLQVLFGNATPVHDHRSPSADSALES